MRCNCQRPLCNDNGLNVINCQYVFVVKYYIFIVDGTTVIKFVFIILIKKIC